ncbi:Alpha/Beta hydrolase protein [Xylariales sp. PMI_506]|nr:Alpha/Beta hydrolase protein [Xylariales sp. PMI_506]
MLRHAFVVCLSAALALAGPTVTVLNGTYQGYHLTEKNQDVFLGMPYAQPPVGPMRFRSPQSLNTSWTATKTATDYGSVCMQYNTVPTYASMSEDCLTINVVRPNVTTCGELPVAVWIYGGGLYSGGSADPSYNLTNFVYQSTLAGKPVIGVSLNYRLTAFGFLWGSSELTEVGSVNNGLRDQRLALHCIQENIEAFGGDPTKVTIWGQSSGALSVGKQLIAYGGRDDGLFRGAILESRSMVEKWPYNIGNASEYMESLCQNLTATTDCSTVTSTLECLRSLPVVDMTAALNVTDADVFPGVGFGALAHRHGREHFNHNATIMYTTTTDEASVFLFGGPVNTDAEFAAAIATSAIATAGADNATIATLELLYPDVNAVGLPAAFEPTDAEDASLGKQYKRAVAFFTDAVETSSKRLTLDTWAAAGLTAFGARHDLFALGASAATGAYQSCKLPFAFNNVDSSAYDNAALQDMSVLMSRMWASFVHDLNPNHHGVSGYPEWPKWNTTNKNGIGSIYVFAADGTNDTMPFVELDNYRLAQTRYINTLWSTQLNY